MNAFHSRTGHYLMLLAVLFALTLPNLGAHSLWDIDEGLNAEAAREMLERGNWITPTFNGELRTAKPALLYWLQMLSYSLLGINEFAARLPSVFMGAIAVLLTYELARKMFDAETGLLAGVVLASSVEFCLLAHAATPDAVLLACTALTFYVFWRGVADGGTSWFVPTGAAAGLAVLAKGPVGVLLPGLIIGLFFLWNGQLRRLVNPRLLLGGLVFALVALPWYVAVAIDTDFAFIRDFWSKHNVDRFLQPLENHSGPFYYYAVGLFAFFAPWCITLGATLWYTIRESLSRTRGGNLLPLAPREGEEPEATLRGMEAYRLLLVWFGAYIIFFSMAATKLPNYVLPVYPALAILTGRTLMRWMRGRIHPHTWVLTVAWVGLILVGVLTGLGLAVIGGSVQLPFGKIPHLAGLEAWAWLGIFPLLGAVAAIVCHWQGARGAVVASVVASAIMFVGGFAAGPALALDMHKAPRALALASGLADEDAHARAACFGWFQPTLVFYAKRQVQKIDNVPSLREFLAQPASVYLFVPADLWAQLAPQLPGTHVVAAKGYDFYRKTEIVVVRNQPAVASQPRVAPR